MFLSISRLIFAFSNLTLGARTTLIQLGDYMPFVHKFNFFRSMLDFFGFPPDICDQHEILNRMMYLLKKFEKIFFVRFLGGHRGKKISKKMKVVFLVNQILQFVQNSTLIQNIWFFSKNIGGQKLALSASLLSVNFLSIPSYQTLMSNENGSCLRNKIAI